MNLLKRSAPLTILSLTAALTGCLSSETDPQSTGEKRQAVYALPRELSDIDVSYLPFDDSLDGGRHHVSLLGAELAVRGLAWASLLAENCDNEDSLNGLDGRHRVSRAALTISRGGQLAVIDPVMSADFVSPEEWIDEADARDVRVGLTTPAFQSLSYDSPCKPDLRAEDMPKDVHAMTPWLFDNLKIDCAYLRRYFADAGQAGEARETKLIARVRELALALDQIGLLERWDDTPLKDLPNDAFCLDPIPPK